MNHPPKTAITLCADDYALHEGVDKGICALIGAKRINAVSVIANSPYLPESAPRLMEVNHTAAVGLHINLTESFHGQVHSTSLKRLMTRAYLGQINIPHLASQLHQQCALFEAYFKHSPHFIDGHQHVHQLKGIRDALQQVIQTRYGHALPWVRHTVPLQRHLGFKSRLIAALGGKRLKKDLIAQAIPTHQGFSGVYGFNRVEYSTLFENWLRTIRTMPHASHLIMCHPAAYFPDDDPIGRARVREYVFFQSPLFLHLLEQYDICLAPHIV